MNKKMYDDNKVHSSKIFQVSSELFAALQCRSHLDRNGNIAAIAHTNTWAEQFPVNFMLEM